MLHPQELSSHFSDTIEDETIIPTGGTIGAVNIKEDFDKISVGFNFDGTPSSGVVVDHEIKVGGQWVVDGSSTIPTEGHVSTFSHVFSEYRAVRTDSAGDRTISATLEANK